MFYFRLTSGVHVQGIYKHTRDIAVHNIITFHNVSRVPARSESEVKLSGIALHAYLSKTFAPDCIMEYAFQIY